MVFYDRINENLFLLSDSSLNRALTVLLNCILNFHKNYVRINARNKSVRTSRAEFSLLPYYNFGRRYKFLTHFLKKTFKIVLFFFSIVLICVICYVNWLFIFCCKFHNVFLIFCVSDTRATLAFLASFAPIWFRPKKKWKKSVLSGKTPGLKISYR